MENFVTVVAKFYRPHDLADGNERIRVREKTLAFSSTSSCTCLRTVSLELQQVNQVNKQAIYTAPKTKINHGA